MGVTFYDLHFCIFWVQKWKSHRGTIGKKKATRIWVAFQNESFKTYFLDLTVVRSLIHPFT